MRRGTRVLIIHDYREGELDNGKTGRFVGYEETEGWALFTADGNPETEAYNLPDGYREWDSDNEPFPKTQCGMRLKNPIFELDDGTQITGAEAYWEPINKRTRERYMQEARELIEKTGGDPSSVHLEIK